MKGMKKYVTLLTAMICLMFIFGLNTKAATFGDFEYTVKNGTVTINRYTGSAAKVTIPSKIAGKKVTAIGSYKNKYDEIRGAFKECDSIKSVVIPEGVKTIEDLAFDYCENLTSVNIPASVTSIGKAAFRRCNISNITIPQGVTTIRNSAFSHTSLKNVIIPKSVKTDM